MSLHGHYDEANIFAKILRGEMPAVKVFEDSVALAIMDVFPQTRGHTLVLPKTPARNFLELAPHQIGPYLTVVQRTARAVEAALKPDGVIVTQFNGSSAGQTVFHLHFHILPVWDGKELKRHGGDKATTEDLQGLAEAISCKL